MSLQMNTKPNNKPNNKPDIQQFPVRIVVVATNDDKQRLDNFLMKYLKGVPRSRIYKMCRKGEVRVNKGRVKPSCRLKVGDSVRIPPVHIKAKQEILVPQRIIKTMEDSIIFENDDILAINKPSGVAVHAGTNIEYGVIEALKQSRSSYLELVHRLDRFTSGCLLLAKNPTTLKYLHEQFRSGLTRKIYHCIVVGKWSDASDSYISSPHKITTGMKRTGEGIRKTIIDPEGTKTVSIFKLLEQFENCSYMDVQIKTGFTHQIRVHAAHTGHPVLGDKVYGDFKVNKKFRTTGVKRQLLHAKSISFIPSINNKSITLEAPLLDDFQEVISKLRSAQKTESK